MLLETGLAAGACATLAVACTARALALFRSRGWWEGIAIGARTIAAMLVVAAIASTAIAQAGWSPLALRQAAFGLALAVIVLHLGLIAWSRADDAGPAADAVALAIALVALWSPSKSPVAACPQRAAAFDIEWVMLLAGAGAALVAGSAGLLLASTLGRNSRFPKAQVFVSLRWATRLSLIALGAGLAVGMWWAWRSAGTLTSGDSRETWMAATGLVSAASLLAWRLPKRSARWAAAMALAASACATLGLLVLPAIRG